MPAGMCRGWRFDYWGARGWYREKEEMRFIFSDEEIVAQTDIRDVFNPKNLLNAGKLFPTPGRCVEMKQVASSIK